MVSAVSDSCLPNTGLGHSNDEFAAADLHSSMNRGLSFDNTLIPAPLSMQDRHPSAPQLASMLASSVDSKPLEMLIEPDEQVSVCVESLCVCLRESEKVCVCVCV